MIFGALDTFADYHAYYRAAANLRTGNDIYAEGKLLVARNSYDFWTQTDGQYVYPPALGFPLLPLTMVSIGQGGAVWLMGLILSTIAFCWLAARLCGRAVGWRSVCAMASLLSRRSGWPRWRSVGSFSSLRGRVVAIGRRGRRRRRW